NRFLDDIDSGSEGTKSKVMFDKVLIANRGAIACRIIRTLHFLGCKAVVIYHEQDKHSLHVQQADEAYSLGAGSIADTYLNQDKIIDIAKSSGANAIHPGYGFLSENPDFSEKCAASDIVFLGPTAHQMLEFGLKHRARELAQQSNVPLLPGSELLTDLDDAIKEASLIGYPVMLKSTAGGGGIGMQICHSEQELAHVFASVKRLSANNFSNDGVFLEKFVERARHIEVQIFGDGRGNVIAIGERDCSLQRRNQKVLEETPAPRLREEVRQALHATAQQLGASVNYRSAGTVEFIYDDASEQFYFLEMNTRLQVEHGVTEQVFGIDLVAWMVRLGAAELSGNYPDLNFTLKPSGHSVQARVYAEDPARNFQPCAGLLSRVEWPKGVSPHGNLRIDSWVESGTQVPSLFDPMLAKVIATADTREAALQQLSDALGQSNLYGIETNIQYLRAIIADEDVKSGNVWTQKLNRMAWQDARISVISAGTQTTVQDLPGRVGYWDIGVPPSGPFDGYSFALGNKLLGNSEDAAGLEITLKGPVLEFGMATQIVLSGATTNATITRAESEISVPFFTVFDIQQGDILDVGTVSGAGTRAYLLLRGGLDCPDYLESKSTFTLGQFGGHNGRSLLPGDVLHCLPTTNEKPIQIQCNADLLPSINDHWEIRVIYGPHGAPDFFTDKDIETFFAS
ncbi:MAG: biotin carboxylase N-terminal domain-containing protein, partial [Oleibacter sp.]|nr:biotin carboxylase N-terminal domain-containing protein [Thalassolituus sp.]